ncbi:hypothetical protein NL676_000950 [Syzygium grande]|nr:hypothetical protein NL676_000950 [Syzygium grande]
MFRWTFESSAPAELEDRDNEKNVPFIETEPGIQTLPLRRHGRPARSWFCVDRTGRPGAPVRGSGQAAAWAEGTMTEVAET